MAEQVVNTVDLSTKIDQPALFTAGNRLLDKIELENSLSKYIDSFINTYAESWGPENTQEVRQAYSNVINAIHDGKVSMNIDGSLQVSDGSLTNSPNLKGFDANAAIAYYVKRVSDTLPDYKEKKKPSKKYTGDTFRRNFLLSLSPNIEDLDRKWFELNWLGLDLEVTDESGNRSRPYTNRLKIFLDFLDREIANLNDYSETSEEYGDIETVKQRMLDLKQRLADGEISPEDNLAISRVGFEPSFFTTLGTPKTEEELAAEEKAAEEAKAAEEEAAKAEKEEANARRGVLGVTTGIYGTDAVNTPQAYMDYLAGTYGLGEKGFNIINNKIQGLLHKAYLNNIEQGEPLTADEKRQLGNFIHFIRTNNPNYKEATVTPEELAELTSHKNFVSDNVFRLPWKTIDGRYIYADNKGRVYFLKPNNHGQYSDLAGTDADYKKNFLNQSAAGQEAAKLQEYEDERNRKMFMSPLDAIKENGLFQAMGIGLETLEDILALCDDGIALIASFFPGLGTMVSAAASLAGLGHSTMADVSRALRGKMSAGDIGKNLATNSVLAAIGLVPGGKSASIAAKAGKVGKTLKGAAKSADTLITAAKVGTRAIPFLLAKGIINDPKPYLESFKKLAHPTEMTVLDWLNIKYVITTAAGMAMSGRQTINARKFAGAEAREVKVQQGENVSTTRVTGKEAAEIDRAGNIGGKAAADAKLREVVQRKTGQTPTENYRLAESPYAENPNMFQRAYGYVRNAKTRITGNQERIGTHTGEYSSTFRAKNHAEELPAAPGINNDYNIYVRGAKPIEFTKKSFESPALKQATTPPTTPKSKYVKPEITDVVLQRLLQEFGGSPGTRTARALATPKFGYPIQPKQIAPSPPTEVSGVRGLLSSGKLPVSAPITLGSYVNSFMGKTFTKNMLRLYDSSKPGLTAQEQALLEGIKANWKSATKAQKEQFANLVLKGINNVKSLELSKLRAAATSGGTSTNSKSGNSKLKPLSSHPLDKIPDGDIRLSNNLSTRGAKFFYLVNHNGKYTIWAPHHGKYFTTKDELHGLEIDTSTIDLSLLGKPVPTSAKNGTKLQQLLELQRSGGIIKAAAGIQINANTSWYNDVFMPYKNYILQQLKGNKDYAKWLNQMLGSHANLYSLANLGNFLDTAYESPDVGTYLTDYLNDPRAIGDKLEYGYNYGIANAHGKNRYIREGLRVGLDWKDTGYKPDNWYSGETDDRRILGRLTDGTSDFSPELLAAFQAELKNIGYLLYVDPKDSYYKLGLLNDKGQIVDLDNGNPVDLALEELPNDNGTPLEVNPDRATIEPNGTTVQPDGTVIGPDGNPINLNLPTTGNQNIPEGSVVNPDGTITTPDGSRINPEQPILKLKVNNPELLLLMLVDGLGISSMLGHIATTNKNYKEAVGALRKIRLLDAPLKYHLEFGDYAGNQVAGNLAALLKNRAARPAYSDASLNEARMFEADNRGNDLIQRQAVLDLDVRQKHAAISEQYANENHAAKVDVGNKNGLLLYDMANRIAYAKQQKNLGNWTSINNYLMEKRYKASLKLDEYKAILENWKANRLGSRTTWIKNALNNDPEYIAAMQEYKSLGSDATAEEKTAIINRMQRRRAEIMNSAGIEWDKLYALVYNVPYYSYSNPFEDLLAINQRYNTPISTSSPAIPSTATLPTFRRGGKSADIYVEAMRNSTSRANSEDITERERLRARKADNDRFMKSIWKAIDVYLKQSLKIK